MYLKKIVLRNIKCFTKFELNFAQDGDVRLWTALLGENGLGKSTLLQAIGVVLAGPAAMRELVPVVGGWVREGQPYGEIEAELLWEEGDALPPGRSKTISPYIARYVVTGDDLEGLANVWQGYYSAPTNAIVDWPGTGASATCRNRPSW